MSDAQWRIAMRATARQAFERGVKAAEPYEKTLEALREFASGENLDHHPGRLIYISLGKAAGRMMEAACALRTPDSALLITNPENATYLPNVETAIGDHPTPSERGERAAKKIEDLLKEASRGDLVILLLSGGASALAPAPLPGVTLSQKIALNDSMLNAGLSIEDINTVRRALSRLKGGGLLRQARPAELRVLVLSDVVNDALRFIGSGPAVQRQSDEDPVSILKSVALWEGQPQSIKEHLSRKHQAEPDETIHHLVGTNRQSVQAMAEGLNGAICHATPLVGDVASVASFFTHAAKERKAPHILLTGGEPTVKVTGHGLGGRNQELALRVAFELEGRARPFVFLSAGSDGRDGPTKAAGAIVDHSTISRMRQAGLSPENALANNDSFTALHASGDLLITGGTGTNVADLHCLILG